MSNVPAADGLFHGTEAAKFVSALIAADRAKASSMITHALRAVLEAGDDLDPAEAEGGLVAVAVLAAEQEPSVLDGVPDADALRAQLADLDTELTPARRTAARGVITRVLLPAENSWLDGRTADADWPQTAADIERLSQVLAGS
jgi:hypothetical protein